MMKEEEVVECIKNTGHPSPRTREMPCVFKEEEPEECSGVLRKRRRNVLDFFGRSGGGACAAEGCVEYFGDSQVQNGEPRNSARTDKSPRTTPTDLPLVHPRGTI